ncbi:DUF3443 domain-containing protein [Paraburkholderia solisilvae]|uniref:Heavy-chain fibroin n=1 Tax=Paraburkholderia solisilvae TaxID=624376 RepID=A0A6J5EPN8_9BURK|nr:DUF3443 domain-containing protein [Paraburkholderia solisilvae]CAB3767182.1 hypothetical protein LMG29739_05021 [Paraburkholderia solisilvae]
MTRARRARAAAPIAHAIAGALALASATILAACGGGGGDSGVAQRPATTAPNSAPVSAPPAAAPSIPQSTTPNVQPIAINALPTRVRNMLTTSVTLCVPATTQCATIDNVQVDTGSQGLRLLASALPAALALPAVAGAGGTAGAGTVSGECGVFGSGYTWGAVRTADIRMAGQVAAGLPIQVIADPALPTVPADCASAGPAMMSPATLHVNGILGVGLFAADCGSACTRNALPRWYYACDMSGACTPSSQPLAAQVTNPVAAFAENNNGVIIELPAVPDAGAPSVTGQLIFGIGTQANNTLGGATVLRTNAQTGYVVTAADGQTWSRSFIDSGSNGMFFASTTLVQCGLWYCPAAETTQTATMAGTDGATVTLSFPVANAQTLFATSNNAFDNLAGISGTTFDWGLPFFFGRRIYTAIEARPTAAGNGPYYAF